MHSLLIRIICQKITDFFAAKVGHCSKMVPSIYYSHVNSVTVYAADLIALIQRRGFVLIFTQMIRRSGSCRPQAIHDLQLRLSACIHGVYNWMKSNRLQLKKLIPTRRSFFGVPLHISINSRGLHAGLGPYNVIPSTIVRDLGTALTQISVCGLTFCCWLFCRLASAAQYPTISTFHRLYSRLWLSPCAVKTGLRTVMPHWLVFLQSA